MDFHNMKRKELQQLCKKHKLPANLSNFEMVDKLSSLFKVQEEEKEKPVRKTRSCLKNSDEMLSKNESDVSKKNVKKVRFNPESDVFQLGEKSERGFALENKGGAGRVTRGRASLLCKTVLISPVVMKKKGKRAVQEVEKEDLVVENKGGASQVTRARASLGKNVVVSSPVVMKKRAKRAVQEVEKKDLDVESKGGVSRVTRARTLVGEKVLIPSPVVMKKKGKKVVQEDEKGGSVVENQGGATRVTRARAGNQVLIPSPVVMKKRGKKAVQEDEKEDLVVENKGGASRVTRARAGKQVLISSPVVMKKRGKRAVQEEKKSGSAPLLVVDFTNPAAEEENEVIAVKFLRNRKVENVPSSKNIVRKRNSQKRSQSTNAEVLENKVAEADGGITQPKISVRRSTRNVNMSEESEGLMDESHETDQKASRKNLRQSTRQRASAKSSIEDADKNTVAVEISQPEVVTRQSKRNRQSTDESTRCQTRHGTKRMSVMPQMKKAKTEKPVAGNLGKKNIVVKDSPEESTKPIVVEEGSETGHIRSSKRNASGDGSLVIAEDENDCGTDIKTVTTKKPRRDAVLEEVPSQYTGRRVNRKVDNISDKPKEETPVASEPRTRSGNRQASLMHSAEKFNMSGNMGPCGTAGEKASPHYTREPSTVPKRSATGARQSKTVSVTPQTRSGSGQKSFIHTTKKLRMAGNSGLHKTLGDKESPHQSREISIVSSCSGTESKGRGLKSKQTPVIHEHSRRFTRSALKGKTDGPAYVRGKINQKKSQSVSKLTLSKVEVDRSTVNLVSNASDLPENKTACSTPQGDSAKTNSVDLYVQESEGPEMINIHEVSPSDPLNLQSNQVELEVDISTLQGGSPKTSTVDLNVQESEGPELMNVHEASPSDPLNLQSNNAGIEMDILTPQGGSPKTRSVDLNVQESERPELINICEALPSNPLILQSIHAELEMDISTPQGSSPKTSSVDLNVQESEGPDLINIREASPGDPLNVQSNHAEFEVDISTPQGGSPETSSVDLNVQESEGPELINILEASPSDTLNLLSNHAVHGDVNEDDTTGTQHENFCKTNVASPHSVHLKADAAAGDVFPADANALTDISLVDQSISTRTEERPELSNDIESISKVIDLNFVFQGPAIHEDEPVYRSPLPEVAEMDNSVTGKSDAACETQQEGPTEVDAKSPPLDHLMSADNIDITGDAGSIDTDYVDDYHLNVEHIISSAIKEKQQEVSENVNDVVAEGSTVNKVKSTAEVGECGPTEQENDICKHPDEFPESGRLDKDSKSASKEVGEAVSSADIFLQTVSMNFTVDKDDKMHPEISVQADEPHNTSSKSGMQEKEFPVPNSIANTEEVSILEYEFSKPEFSDTVTSTVMCSNKEFEEDNNQRLSTVESCLMREESGTKICIEFSTSNVVADSVAGENNKSQPRAPSSPLHATEFDNIVVEVKEELKPEDSPLSWRSDIFERIAVDGSSLQKERNLAKSTDVSEHNHWKNAEVKFENRKKVGAFDSTTREMSDMPEFTSSLPSHGTELGHLVAEVKEVKPKDSSSLWSTENVPKRTAEDGSSLHKQVGIEGREVEEMVFEDTVENASERTSSMFGDAHHILDGQQPTERECDLGEMTCSISGDVEERRMNENISRERTLFISKHDVDRGNISSPVIAHEFPSSVDDHCHTPSEDSCGKEQDMSMVKSSKNFGKEFSSQHDYFYGQLKDSCGKEEGTPMSIVKSSKYCGEEFSGQHDKIIDQVKVCSTAALPQTICEDFAGFDNQILPDLMGSTGRRMSRTGDLNIVKFEETEPSTVITDKIVDGIESLKENSSTLVRNLVEDSGGYCEKSDAEIATHDISEEDCYGKDAIDSYQIEDTVNYGEIDSNFKVIRQENDARPYLLHMDVDTINVEHFRDNLIASDTIHRFDQDTDASGMPTEEFPRYEEAMDADAPANLQDAGESVTLTGETNKAQGVPTEELTRTEDAMDADAPANVQYGNQEADTSGIPTEDFPRYEEAMDADAPANLQDAGESVTLTGETNKAQGVPTEELTITEDAMDADAPANLQYGNQEADASGMPTEEFPRYEEAMDADAPANLQDADAGESVTLTGETNKAQGNLCAIAWVPTEELTITEDAMDADAPANLQYGRESLTIPGETNQAQERGPEDISFCSDFFGPELKSRSDEVDGEESQSWFENSSFPGIELDSFMVSPTEEQLQNSGEKHAREKDPESIENQHAAFNNPSTGGDNVSVENSVGTLNESHIESEANKNAHQKVDCYNSNRSDEDFTKTES